MWCFDYINLNDKYDIGTSFLDIIQIKSNIPIEWKETLKQCSHMSKNIPSWNIIKLITIQQGIKNNYIGI